MCEMLEKKHVNIAISALAWPGMASASAGAGAELSNYEMTWLICYGYGIWTTHCLVISCIWLNKPSFADVLS